MLGDDRRTGHFGTGALVARRVSLSARGRRACQRGIARSAPTDQHPRDVLEPSCRHGADPRARQLRARHGPCAHGADAFCRSGGPAGARRRRRIHSRQASRQHSRVSRRPLREASARTPALRSAAAAGSLGGYARRNAIRCGLPAARVHDLERRPDRRRLPDAERLQAADGFEAAGHGVHPRRCVRRRRQQPTRRPRPVRVSGRGPRAASPCSPVAAVARFTSTASIRLRPTTARSSTTSLPWT